MITLTPITDAAKLQEYYRFRYRIYSESRQAGFVHDKKDGLDIDRYDARALHYGWYLNGELVGCIRFVEPDNSMSPLPMFSYVQDGTAIDAIRMYITMRRAHGQRMVEASRFCLAPEHRGLRTAKEFVLAMADALHKFGIEKALFDCHLRHAPFYGSLGFKILGGAEQFHVPQSIWSGCTMSYDYSEIQKRKNGVTLTQGWNLEKAA